jgi:hypothetical protein
MLFTGWPSRSVRSTVIALHYTSLHSTMLAAKHMHMIDGLAEAQQL